MSTAAETVTKPAAETATKPAAEPVTKPVEASTPETTKAPITQDRIYIGNLPAKVKYDEIREFLDGLTVKDIRIPKSSNTFRRGPRRVAHAFVTLGSAKEVEKAVETLNEKTFGDKTVTVNVARPKTETEDKPKAKKAAARGEKSADASAATEASGETDKAAKKDATSSKSSPKKKSKAFKKEPIPGSVSHEDTIFVSNLPFGVKKEQLSELFKDLEPQWTYISMGSVPRPTGSFKYVYGFVKFSDSAAQEKALKDYSEVSLGNRKLRVAAAKERVPTAESEATEDSTSTTKTSPPASASASPETKETEA